MDSPEVVCTCEYKGVVCQYDPYCRARPQMTSYYERYEATCPGIQCSDGPTYCGCP